MSGRETTAMPVITMAGPRSDEAALPDDPTELKRLLRKEREAHDETKRENARLISEHWIHAMDGMVAKSLRAATFVAQPDGKILRWSDPAGLCCSLDDEIGGNVFSAVFDRLQDPRDVGSSSEDTGVRRIPRMFGQEFKDALAKAMKSDAMVQPLRRSVRVIFHQEEVAILHSPSKGAIDVLVAVSYGLDHNGHDWLHVSVVDVDAANRDELTGLRRRRTLVNSVARDIAECKRNLHDDVSCKPVYVTLFDGDGLKRINDTHGHYVGDQVIQALARRAKRVFDRPTDLLARLGGDEFAGKGLGTFEDAQRQAEKLRRSASLPISVRLSPDSEQRIMIDMTVSIGIAVFGPEIESAEDLINLADKALYESKQGGRDRVTTKMKALKRS